MLVDTGPATGLWRGNVTAVGTAVDIVAVAESYIFEVSGCEKCKSSGAREMLLAIVLATKHDGCGVIDWIADADWTRACKGRRTFPACQL